jgi:hypothetical protein
LLSPESKNITGALKKGFLTIKENIEKPMRSNKSSQRKTS